MPPPDHPSVLQVVESELQLGSVVMMCVTSHHITPGSANGTRYIWASRYIGEGYHRCAQTLMTHHNAAQEALGLHALCSQYEGQPFSFSNTNPSSAAATNGCHICLCATASVCLMTIISRPCAGQAASTPGRQQDLKQQQQHTQDVGANDTV